MAANKVGKTYSASYEVAIHCTGLYPDWWKGFRFNKPILCWAGGQTNETTRDTVQDMLMGPPGSWGEGAIPKSHILDITRARGLGDYIDTAQIKNEFGGTTLLRFKSAEQGARKWWGPNVGLIWLDEEFPIDVYQEAHARTAAHDGRMLTTFTPLLGLTEVVEMFYPEPNSPDRCLVNMDLEDAAHFSEHPERMRQFVENMTPYEKDARSKGIPLLGSGRIFQVPEEDFAIEPFKIPSHFLLLGGIDFGYTHPTGLGRIAIDPDSNRIFLTHTYKRKEGLIAEHASVMRQWGPTLRWAWPKDGIRKDTQSGVSTADAYRNEKVQMLPQHATFKSGGYGVNTGIGEMASGLLHGQFKVFYTCTDFFDEYRTYHRKNINGQSTIVKEKDDVLDAVRHAFMMKRFARPGAMRVEQPHVVGMDWSPLEPRGMMQ